MKLIHYIVITCLFIFSSTAFSQGRTITGNVIDDMDQPVPGVSILLKPYSIGTITNSKGEFSLSIPASISSEAKIIASFIGMKTETIPLSEQNYYAIQLVSEMNILTQVVVTSSYGTQKLKEDVVGSITTIQSKDIQANQSFTSVDKMLDGQLAGVTMEMSETPLEPVTINIRGQGTLSLTNNNTALSTSTQPLIIIDGVIVSEEKGIDNSFFDGTGTYSEDMMNPLSRISADDIESINVLKDAAAVGIYGADGANGVIIITTKSGHKGHIKFNANVQQGISTAVNRIKYLNGQQYTTLYNEYQSNSGGTEIADNSINTDWFELLNRNGAFQKYGINANGGTDHISYRIGLNYIHNKESQLGNYSNQYQLSTNLRYNNKKLKITLSLAPGIVQKYAPNIYYNYAFAPNIAPYNEDGTYGEVGVTGMANPLAAIEQNRNKTNNAGLLGSLNVNYDILQNWTVSTTFATDYKDKKQDRYFSGENESGRTSGTFTLDGVTYNKYGRRVINERNTFAWTWTARTNYNLDWNDKHHFDAMAGFELYKQNEDLHYESGVGFVNPNIVNSVSAALRDDDPDTPNKDETTANQTISDDTNNNARVSFFTQLNYNLYKKYYILVNIRRDESSVFGDNTNVAYNGGLGLSWVLSKENFLNNTGWIDFLRLRTSFGSTGNSRIGSYTAKGVYTVSENQTGYNQLNYAYPSSAPNPNLGWEKNYKYDLGLDFNFLNRFTFTAEYFHDAIKDMISSREIPYETGYSSTMINGTNMVNQGIELALGTKIIDTENWKWNVNINFATLKNEITSLTSFGDSYSTGSLATAIKKGYSTSTLWGAKYAGIDPATGRELVNKSGQIYDLTTYRSLFNETDWEPLGNTQPDFYGGFCTGLTFKKRLNLSIRGSYKYGNSKLIDDDLISKYSVLGNRNLSVNAFDYWKEPGDIATQPIVTSSNPVFPNLSKYVYDASYLKINNINISYQLPTERMHIFLKALSVNFDVSNVATFYKNKSPEGKNGIKEFYYTYPQSRIWSMGLHASF